MTEWKIVGHAAFRIDNPSSSKITLTSAKAINEFSEVHVFGIYIDFFDFGVGSHHGG